MPLPITIILYILLAHLGILLLVLLLIGLILCLRVKLTVTYGEELIIVLKLLFYKYYVYPDVKVNGPHRMSRGRANRILSWKRKKAEWRKKERESRHAELNRYKKRKQAAGASGTPSGSKKRSLSIFFDDLSLILKLLRKLVRRFGHHLHVDVARIKLKIGTDDAATTAVAYGATCQIINVLLPILKSSKHFSLPKKTDLDVQADFLSDEIVSDVKITFSMRIWQLLDVIVRAVIVYLEHREDRLPPDADEKIGIPLLDRFDEVLKMVPDRKPKKRKRSPPQAQKPAAEAPAEPQVASDGEADSKGNP